VRDSQANSIGWSVCRLYNYALTTNSQIWQVIGGNIQSIGCVLDPYRYRLAVVSRKLIADTPFRINNSCLLFMASPSATAQIFQTTPINSFLYATTDATRQSVDGKTVGTLTITGAGNTRTLTIPRTTTSFQVTKRRFAVAQRALVSGAVGYPARRYLTPTVSETTDVLLVRV
jgi:hypothetical protein